MTHREFLWLLRVSTLLPVAALIGLFLGPVTPALAQTSLSDGQAHAASFFAITSALLILWPRQSPWIIAAGTIAASGAIELLQRFTGRGPSLDDMNANALGVSLAIGTYLVVCRFRTLIQRTNEGAV